MRRRLVCLAALGGTGSGCLVLGIFVLNAGLIPGQGRFLWSLLAVLTLLGVLIAIPVYARFTSAIVEYLEARRTNSATDALRHRAFRQVMSCPKRMMFFGYSYYPICSAILSIACVARFEEFGHTTAVLMVLCGAAMGFPCQMALYVPFRWSLDGVRNQLALEIPDPKKRQELNPVFSLPSKISLAMISLAVITVIVMSSLVQLRAKRTLSTYITADYSQILKQLGQRYAQTQDPNALLHYAQATYGTPMGLHFELLRPSGTNLLTTDASLNPVEIAYILQSPMAGSSASISTRHIFAWATLPDESGILTAFVPRNRVNALVHKARGPITIIGGALCLIAIATTLLFAIDLKRSFDTLKRQLRSVAQGDLHQAIIFESEDEFGELGRDIDGMATSLREMVRSVAETVRQVEHTAEEISTVAHDVSTATTHQFAGIHQATEAMTHVTERADGIAHSAHGLSQAMDASAQSATHIQSVGSQLNRNAVVLATEVESSEIAISEMIERIQEVSEKTEQLTAALSESVGSVAALARQISEIERNASEMERLSNAVTQAASHGKKQVDKTTEGMHAIASATNTVREVIQDLGHRVLDIAKIVEIIDNVADETNLLALNASIISAQAGKHGGAFSVVSTKIKELANRVGTRTKEINQLIVDLQVGSANATRAMEESVPHVQSGVKLSTEASSALQEITTSANESNQRVKEIVASVEEHQNFAHRVLKLMEHLTANTERIQTANTEQIEGTRAARQAATAVGEITREINTSTENQEQSTISIARNLEEVSSAVANIHASLQDQLTACLQTTAFLKELRQRTRINEQAGTRMEEATKRLLDQSTALRRDIQRFRL